MKTLVGTIVWKEWREILRDPITIAVAVILPLLMLYIFGSALSLDVKKTSIAIYDLDRSPASRNLVDAFLESGYFKRGAEIMVEDEVAELLDRGRVQMVLAIPPDFSEKLERGEVASVQTLADGSFSATAMLVVGYADAIIYNWAMQWMEQSSDFHFVPVRVEGRVWFNAPLESKYYIVPGLFGVILMAFPPLLTALAVVREKETGSVQQIFVSPIHPWQFIAGKMIPYAVIAFIEMLMILVVGTWWFEIPLRGNLLLFLAATVIYVLCTVCLGLLVSSVTRSQLVAIMLAFVVTLMPSFLFSGFLFPIFTMPFGFQMYTHLFPARYFVEISRGIIMKDVGLTVLWPVFLALIIYTILLFALTSSLFRKKVA